MAGRGHQELRRASLPGKYASVGADPRVWFLCREGLSWGGGEGDLLGGGYWSA